MARYVDAIAAGTTTVKTGRYSEGPRVVTTLTRARAKHANRQPISRSRTRSVHGRIVFKVKVFFERTNTCPTQKFGVLPRCCYVCLTVSRRLQRQLKWGRASCAAAVMTVQEFNQGARELVGKGERKRGTPNTETAGTLAVGWSMG